MAKAKKLIIFKKKEVAKDEKINYFQNKEVAKGEKMNYFQKKEVAKKLDGENSWSCPYIYGLSHNDHFKSMQKHDP